MNVSTSTSQKGEFSVLLQVLQEQSPAAGATNVNANTNPFPVSGSDSADAAHVAGTLTDMSGGGSWNGTLDTTQVPPAWTLDFNTMNGVASGDYLQVNVHDSQQNSDQVGFRQKKSFGSHQGRAEQGAQGYHYYSHGAQTEGQLPPAIIVTLTGSPIDPMGTQTITVQVNLPGTLPAGQECLVFLAKLKKSYLGEHGKLNKDDQRTIAASGPVMFDNVPFGSWDGVAVVATTFTQDWQPGTLLLKSVQGD